jgi:OmpA-OmpF porin, OOP family
MKTLVTSLFLLIVICSFGQNAPLIIQVSDFDNNPLQGEQVLLVDQVSNKIFKGISDSKGTIDIEIPAGKYDIKLKSIGDAEEFSTFEVPKLGQGQAYQTATMQIQIQEAKEFTLDNLQFDIGKWTIKKTSFSELNELVEFMLLKKNLKIEIGGHTDSDGETASNLTLSQKRADAVKKYLLSKGVSADRVKSVGYGEGKPIADNNTNIGKAKNRRTEVRVVE